MCSSLKTAGHMHLPAMSYPLQSPALLPVFSVLLIEDLVPSPSPQGRFSVPGLAPGQQKCQRVWPTKLVFT